MQSTYRIPSTQILSAFDDQLLIFVRSWAETESMSLISDEIKQYLSATQADLEVTTPFSFIEGYSPLANRLRIATLLANDRLFKNQNKEFYSSGAELALICHSRTEIAWASYGNFDFYAHLAEPESLVRSEAAQNSSEPVLFHAQKEIIESRHILPGHLLGIERMPSIAIGSLQKFLVDRITLSSQFCFGEAKWLAEISDF